MSKDNARFKQWVVKDYLSGKGASSRTVVRALGLDHGTVRKWRTLLELRLEARAAADQAATIYQGLTPNSLGKPGAMSAPGQNDNRNMGKPSPVHLLNE